MIISTAFSNRDSHAAAAMFAWIANLSGRIDAQCVLVHEPQVDPSPVAREAVKAFSKVSQHQVTPALVPALDRWPHAPNIYFASTAEAMSRQGEPWYFMEPDNLPTDPMWYYKLQRAYFASGQRCMGAFFPSWFEQNGKWIPAGKHLTGTAIYPADLWNRSQLIKFLVRMTHDSTRQGIAPQAFDVYLAGELVKQSQETPLIQHTWRSHNFRLENGIITFDVIDPENKGLARTLGIRTTNDPESCVLHGCKDGSALNLLRKLHGSGELRETLLRSQETLQKAPEAFSGLRTAETNAEVNAPVLEPFVPVRPKKVQPEEGSEWGDTLQPDAFHERPEPAPCSPALPNPEQPKIAARVTPNSPAELHEARTKFKTTQHYDGCMSKTPVLHHNGSHYELRCECGLRLPLAPGTDWNAVWKGDREAAVTVDASEVESKPEALSPLVTEPIGGDSFKPFTPVAAPESHPPAAADEDHHAMMNSDCELLHTPYTDLQLTPFREALPALGFHWSKLGKSLRPIL